MFDIWRTTDGMVPAPCRLVASLLVKRNGGAFVTRVDLAGWSMDAQPVIILPNGKLGSPTKDMEVSDVRPA